MGTILRTRQTAIPARGADVVLSDEALAACVRNGDERAFEQLYARHGAPLRRYCASILRQPEDAEEALQSAMLSAFLALAAGDPGDLAVRPWLYRIAHNQCVDILRRRPPQPTAAFTGREAHRAPGVAERVEMADDIRRLRRDLLALPDDQRGALVMREMAGLSHQQIAAALDETPAGVKQLIYQARLALQAMAAGRDLDCATVRDRIATGDGRVLRARDLKAHLRACATCDGVRRAARPHPRRLAALLPACPAALLEPVLSALRALGGAGAGGATAGAGAGVLGAGGAAGLSAGTGITLGTTIAAGLIAGAAILAPASFGDMTAPAAERPAAAAPGPEPHASAPAAAILFIAAPSGSAEPVAPPVAIAAAPDTAPGQGPAVVPVGGSPTAIAPPAEGPATETPAPGSSARGGSPTAIAPPAGGPVTQTPAPGSSAPAPAGAGDASGAADAPAPRRRPVAPGPPQHARAQPSAGPAGREPGPPVDTGSAAAPRRPAPTGERTGRGTPQAPHPSAGPSGPPAASGPAHASPPGPGSRPDPAAKPGSAVSPATPANPATDAGGPADPPGRPAPGGSAPAATPAGSSGR